jgi:lipopolysaccharide transport system permease protein
MDKASLTERVIRPRQGKVSIDVAELLRYRELLFFLAWRDILIRYKQTAIGVAWAVIQPLLTMVVFTVLFSKAAKFPSHGMPYAVMTFAAILPWQFFANAMTTSSSSIVGAANIVRKIYFPRLIIPLSTTLSGIVDFAISFLILLGLMTWYGVAFRWHLLLLPVFLLFALLAAFAAGIWLSALNVKYRDVKYVVPFLVRMGMYVSPVGFMSDIVPDTWRFWYSLNPMVGVIDGFRWAVLGPTFEPYWPGFAVSVAVVAVCSVTGIYHFRATERTFADII